MKDLKKENLRSHLQEQLAFKKMLIDEKDGLIVDLYEKIKNFQINLSEARNKERELLKEIEKLKTNTVILADKPFVQARNRSAGVVKESHTMR